MKKYLPLVLATTLSLLFGCAKDPGIGNGGTTEGGEDLFAFKTKQACTVDLNYALQGYNSHVRFSIYAENPYDADGNLTDEEPLLRAIADSEGNYTGEIQLPTHIKNVYIQSSELGMPSVITVPVTGRTIAFSMNDDLESKAATRATTSKGYFYPDNIKVLGGWDANGVPDYAKNANLPTGFADDVKAFLPLNQDLATSHPELFTGVNRSVDVVEGGSNKIELYFVHEDHNLTNAIGYYTYPTGTHPDISEVQLILAFPNVSFKGSGGGLQQGNMVQLQYWNGTGFQGFFPEGVTIGFFAMPNGFVPSGDARISSTVKAGSVNYDADYATFYSNNFPQQIVTLGYAHNNKHCIVLGFEMGSNNNTGDFRDMVLSLEASPNKALAINQDIPVNPNPEPPIEDNYTEHKGTLIFEDLWPYRGDYDINDAVIEYTCKVYTDLDNNVVRTEDVFSPVFNGASLQGGFAYQYGVHASAFKSIDVTQSHPSGIGPRSNYVAIPWDTENGFETGQDLATVKIFDDIRSAVNPSTPDNPVKYTVKTEFNQPQDPKKIVPPYNPFMMIVAQDDIRAREVHLADHKPTDKASLEWFGKGHDKSQIALGLYYFSADNYPFAIDIPIHNFQLVPENSRVGDRKMRIDDLYPQYHDWAASKGVENDKWYLSPQN